jgi:anaerobic selenocysteine-containing dehydrogenase
MHPDDATQIGVTNGGTLVCESETGKIEAIVEIDDSVRPGMVMLPHGYGQRFKDGAATGPQINRLTSTQHCDPLMRTPFHKYVPVRLTALSP